MRAMMLRRLHEERGATAVIVAICLVAILAMLVLTVDVGGLLYKRRELVSGSDAAALAAAQSCAVTTDRPPDDPEAMADRYAGENVNGLSASGIGSTTNILEKPGCDSKGSGHVKVQYSMPQQLYFAQVLGFGRTSPVTTQATAAWGPLAGGFPLPIVLDSGQYQGACSLPSDDPADIGKECSFWYDNSIGNIRNLDPLLGTASWGYMNLNQWGVAGDANCSNGGSSERSGWIKGSTQVPGTLNGDPPGSAATYVCVDTGHSTTDWQDLKNESLDVTHDPIRSTKLFPVNYCGNPPPPSGVGPGRGQVDKSGVLAPCPLTPDKYDVIGFTSLLIEHVYRGDDPLAYGVVASNNKGCQKSLVDWPASSPMSLNTVLDGGANVNNKCPTSAPDTIPYDSVKVFSPGRGNVELVKCPPVGGAGCDYRYDEATHVITWVGGAQAGTTVQFDWSIAARVGACGIHTPDPNAICMVTQWEGYTTSPGPIGSGADLGSRGIRLCDRTITGSCPKGS